MDGERLQLAKDRIADVIILLGEPVSLTDVEQAKVELKKALADLGMIQ
jgi:hypothetical protein